MATLLPSRRSAAARRPMLLMMMMSLSQRRRESPGPPRPPRSLRPTMTKLKTRLSPSRPSLPVVARLLPRLLRTRLRKRSLLRLRRDARPPLRRSRMKAKMRRPRPLPLQSRRDERPQPKRSRTRVPMRMLTRNQPRPRRDAESPTPRPRTQRQRTLLPQFPPSGHAGLQPRRHLLLMLKRLRNRRRRSPLLSPRAAVDVLAGPKVFQG